jgi:hypothetical protein
MDVRSPVHLARRALSLLAVVAALQSWPHSESVVSADHVPTHDPETRLQVVIKRIVLHDISEPFYESEAEVKLSLFFLRVDPSCPAYSLEDACLRDLATVHFPQMDMSEGESRVIERTVPLTEDAVATDGSISTAFGIPVYEGQAYRMVIYGYDEDSVPGFDDFLGRIDRIISGGDGWVAPPNLQRAVDDDSGNAQGGPGKFSLEYEIRRIPLPDLEPTDIKLLDLAGAPNDTVCVSVLNRGAMDAGPFETWLVLDGAIPPLGKAEAGKLDSGQAGELCMNVTLPTTGNHYLTALVDEPRGIFEENDTNNRYAEPYNAPQNATGGGSSSTPPPSGPADLFLSGLSIKGERTNGASGCDPGRNDITVSIKNLGGTEASNFVVQLTARPEESNDNEDDGISQNKIVATFNAGASQDVEFQDVRLNRGLYEMEAIVDARRSVSESDEDNNEFKLTVNCQP